MKKIFLHTSFSVLLVLIATGCTMNKNTWTTRTYKAINTKYNVKFNGQTSFDEGIKSIQKANVEDFSEVLPMYPISKPANAKVATSNMDRAIEKSRKAIKLHSIKKKPVRNPRKANNAEYKLFYNQEEFNPALKDVWMLLAMSEFHKGDFMGSVGTFSYIARHYATDKEMVVKSQLWIARAYSEMGWIYEAEQLLSKINQNDITYKITPLYTAVNADLMIKKHQYKEAIPFLEITLAREKNKYQKQRFTYILAQLYERTDDKIKALETYRKVLKLTPSYEMDFNARVSSIELNPNVTEVRKEIRKLIKNPNNKDYLDQLYFAKGKTYLQKGDTAKALENFALSVEKSTRNGTDKAITLITMGDLYYQKQNYVKAQPCYDEASKIITVEHPDYKRISSRAISLGELVVEYETVVLQDSLQKLATFSDEKRLEIVKKIIDKLIADEKAEAEKAQKGEDNNQNSGSFEPDFMPQPVANRGGGSGGEWYFYNPTLMKSGQQDFQKKWGKRKLEDNWRRMNKSAAIFAENVENKLNVTENIQADSIQSPSGTESKTEVVSDNKDPKFYLQQIPVTDAQIQKSNEMIADALFKMGFIYKDKVEDFGIALNTFTDFITRFPADERVPEAMFQMFLLNTMLGKTAEAQTFRAKLRSDYPSTRFAVLLANPDFLAVQEEMLQVQDSVYNITYMAFNQSKFQVVKQNSEVFIKKYPQSKLVPKFMFLNALSIGKTENPEKFAVALDELVTNFPASDVSSMSKDILALMKQGKESKTGTSQGTLLARRAEVLLTGDSATVAQNFSASKDTRHRLLFVIPADDLLTNKLLYNIAAFNFSRFMVKDFDLVVGKIDSLQNSLSVTGFETYDETSWYLNSLLSDDGLKSFIDKPEVQQIIISENNYGLLRTVFTINDYLAYHTEKIVTAKPEIKTVASATPKTQNTAVSQNKQTTKTQTPKTQETKSVAAVTPSINQDNKLDREYLERATSIPEKSVVPDQATSVGTQAASQPAVEKSEPEAPLYKNLFAYKPTQPHFIALAIVSGNINFEKTKEVFDKYNADNYGIMNLKVSLETIGRMQFVIIGQFTDANVAKSYLLRMVREKPLFQNMGDASYRNLVGTQANLNVMVQENALRTYLEFMQEYYLK